MILQGHPNADMVMEVENDEWILRHGRCILMKVAADGDDVLSADYVESVLEIVKQSLFCGAATFSNDVTINGRFVVDGPITAFRNLRQVTSTTGLLQVYVDPTTGEIVASQH